MSVDVGDLLKILKVFSVLGKSDFIFSILCRRVEGGNLRCRDNWEFDFGEGGGYVGNVFWRSKILELGFVGFIGVVGL